MGFEFPNGFPDVLCINLFPLPLVVWNKQSLGLWVLLGGGKNDLASVLALDLLSVMRQPRIGRPSLWPV